MFRQFFRAAALWRFVERVAVAVWRDWFVRARVRLLVCLCARAQRSPPMRVAFRSALGRALHGDAAAVDDSAND